MYTRGAPNTRPGGLEFFVFIECVAYVRVMGWPWPQGDVNIICVGRHVFFRMHMVAYEANCDRIAR